MQRFLEKISWKLRRIEITFTPICLNWSGGWSYFHFSICKIQYGLKSYSLFEIAFRLPNKTTIKHFYVNSWDILFIKNYLFDVHEKLSDQDRWNVIGMSSWDKFRLKVLNKIL